MARSSTFFVFAISSLVGSLLALPVLTGADSEETARPCVIRFIPVTSVSETDFTVPEGHWSGDLFFGTGSAQRVILDVTSVVRSWTAGDDRTLGALAARDIDGEVGIVVSTDRLGTGVAGRLRVWTAPGH